MRWLITYDVVDDRRRARLARTLEARGDRVQYSVFECELNPEQMRTLEIELGQHIDPTEDGLRCYPICTPCLNRSQHSGRADPPGSRRSYYLI